MHNIPNSVMYYICTDQSMESQQWRRELVSAVHSVQMVLVTSTVHGCAWNIAQYYLHTYMQQCIRIIMVHELYIVCILLKLVFGPTLSNSQLPVCYGVQPNGGLHSLPPG